MKSVKKSKTKEIRLYKNAEMINKHHGKKYKIKEYAEIEFFNNEIIKLDIQAKADITDCDYIEIINKGKLVKTIFRNELA